MNNIWYYNMSIIIDQKFPDGNEWSSSNEDMEDHDVIDLNTLHGTNCRGPRLVIKRIGPLTSHILCDKETDGHY